MSPYPSVSVKWVDLSGRAVPQHLAIAMRAAPLGGVGLLAAALVVALTCMPGCHGGAQSPPMTGTDAGGAAPGDSGAADAGDAGLDSGPGDTGVPTSTTATIAVTLTARVVDSRFRVAEHMRASLEMQLSGEPFAQLLGYDLTGFDRTLSLTDQYTDPATKKRRTDPLGYALAVESYEYSKQPMNNLSFESGAGLSLMFGPVLNPRQVTGAPAFTLLVNRFQQFAIEADAAGSAGDNLVVTPPPQANPLNYYGWPGLWPVFAEFQSFDPAIHPTPGLVNSCTSFGTIPIAYAGGVPSSMLIANYECDYNSLNLPDRDAQVTRVLSPDALGYAVWKQGLWVINYWGSLHDTAALPIVQVSPGDMATVGQAGNSVVGQYVDPMDPTGTHMLAGQPGVYLGDTPMEGWQGQLMMDEIDNKSALLLGSLLSAGGGTLTGTTVAGAIGYRYDSPLLYFPAEVGVTEVPTSTSPGLSRKLFPRPSSFAIVSAASRLQALSGLIGGYGEAFAFTDKNNAQVGGSVPFLVTFDGDPFPADNGRADGENTLHDRALGVLKIALVDLDRLHFDPTARVLVDTASVTGGQVHRGTRVGTVELAGAISALRNAFRGLNGTLQLYSNDTPDTLGVPSALDGAPLGAAGYTGTLQARISDLIRAEADFLSARLVDPSGRVANAYDLSTGHADPSPTGLEAEAAAIRGLLEAYLATSDPRYRSRAIAVYADLEQRFWMDDAKVFRTTAGVDSRMQYTPTRFGFLSGALRQYYKLVGSTPGHEAESQVLLDRMKRTYKLVLNGWNDRNQDDRLQYPEECLGAGLELGERALTGELGHPADKGDRDKDCVREISFARLPAALGAELDLERP